MSHALSGAALHSRVEKQLREELAAVHGLPIHEYTCEVQGYDDYSPVLYAKFTRGNGATIEITDIYTDDDGEILQTSRAELG